MTWVGVGVGAASIGSSLWSGSQAKKAAAEAAKEQASLVKEQRKEEIRYKTRQARQEEGMAEATVYASNLLNEGSSKRYLQDMNLENVREKRFAERASHLEQRAILAGARGAGDSFYQKAAGDAIGLAVKSFATAAATPTTDTSTHFGGAANNPLAKAQPSTYTYTDVPGGMQA